MKTSKELAQLQIDDCCDTSTRDTILRCNRELLLQRFEELLSLREYFFNQGKLFPNESFENFMNIPIEWNIGTNTYKLVKG